MVQCYKVTNVKVLKANGLNMYCKQTKKCKVKKCFKNRYSNLSEIVAENNYT